MEIREFSHVVPIDIPVGALSDSKRKFTQRITARRIDFLMTMLDLHAERVREKLSAWGEPLSGTDFLHPRTVSQSSFSQWLSGRSEIPQFRLAQLILVIESAMVEQEVEARLRLEPDDPLLSIFSIARKNIAELEKDEELRLLTDRFRVTLRRLLREHASDGPAEAIRAERYAQYLHDLGIGTKVGERHKKPLSGGNQSEPKKSR